MEWRASFANRWHRRESTAFRYSFAQRSAFGMFLTEGRAKPDGFM
jgi:hypothetical protein